MQEIPGKSTVQSNRSRWRSAWIASLGLITFAGVVWAAEILPGPIPAVVTEVVDGDTIGVRARIWLGQDVEIRVRILDIDTPEIRGDCETERSLAIAARDRVVALALGQQIQMWETGYGKYAGRITARVTLANGLDLGAELIHAGLARPYDGGARQSWCEKPVDGA
ncbi:MAG: nuclease [Alphaproteobacteria bacterium]|jgi:micrococcal nuclease|nr:nuclease [Alphaproteobacteria bacterium]MBT4710412.1 nuclease [Alphaproteobacteria bacterium]MBT5860005.1 nuclease [Alphaproteobacteria bacterium]